MYTTTITYLIVTSWYNQTKDHHYCVVNHFSYTLKLDTLKASSSMALNLTKTHSITWKQKSYELECAATLQGFLLNIWAVVIQ